MFLLFQKTEYFSQLLKDFLVSPSANKLVSAAKYEKEQDLYPHRSIGFLIDR